MNGSTTFNSISTYACRMGFMVVGSVSRTCQGDGQWSGSEPTCQSEGDVCTHVLGVTIL